MANAKQKAANKTAVETAEVFCLDLNYELGIGAMQETIKEFASCDCAHGAHVYRMPDNTFAERCDRPDRSRFLGYSHRSAR